MFERRRTLQTGSSSRRWRSIVRAQSSTAIKRRHAQRKFRHRAHHILMTEAANLIHEGNAASARANLKDAFRLRPFRTVVSGPLLWLLAPGKP